MTEDRLKEIETELDQVTHVRVMAIVNFSGFKYFELRMEQQHPMESKKFRYMGTSKLPLVLAQKQGVTKTLNGSKKVGAWVSTDEGRQFVIDMEKRRWRRQYEQQENWRAKRGVQP